MRNFNSHTKKGWKWWKCVVIISLPLLKIFSSSALTLMIMFYLVVVEEFPSKNIPQMFTHKLKFIRVSPLHSTPFTLHSISALLLLLLFSSLKHVFSMLCRRSLLIRYKTLIIFLFSFKYFNVVFFWCHLCMFFL